MGTAYFIVLERPAAGLDTSMDGKSLAREIEDLDWTAKEIGVRPLSEFVSVNPEMALEFLEGEGVSTSDIPLLELQQFSAEDGLKSVRMLLREIQAWVPGTKDTSGVLADLRECERILDAAARQGVRWHFELDM
jgi:hypothetical protein